MRKRIFPPDILLIYISVWFIINLLFLKSFPFMHTDEAWLAGLSRTILLTRNPAATETVFDLMPRSPHAIKIIFHFLQILLIKTAGYNLFSVRLLSLLSGTMILTVFSAILKKLKLPAFSGILLLSLDIQFIYAAHFARQEIIILLLMLLSLNALLTEGQSSIIRGLKAGLPLALAAGVHPNAFTGAFPPGLFLLVMIISRRRSLAEGVGFLSTGASGAALFIGLSFLFNSGFISDYSAFGESVGVLAPLDIKILGFDDFYRKLFIRISGTYYTPNIIPVFILSGVGLAATIATFLKNRKFRLPLIFSLIGLFGVNTGIILTGKYSAPSIIFQLPFLIILIVCGTKSLSRRLGGFFTAAAAVVLLANSVLMIRTETGINTESFTTYNKKISASVSPDRKTLGGLSAGFHFDDGMLLDWRNLSFLNDEGLTVSDYIRSANIEYIIYTDEIDYIYETRPVWNILYGNPAIYYEALNNFLQNDCNLITSFVSPGYGTRLTLKRYERNWNVKIYQVKSDHKPIAPFERNHH